MCLCFKSIWFSISRLERQKKRIFYAKKNSLYIYFYENFFIIQIVVPSFAHNQHFQISKIIWQQKPVTLYYHNNILVDYMYNRNDFQSFLFKIILIQFSNEISIFLWSIRKVKRYRYFVCLLGNDTICFEMARLSIGGKKNFNFYDTINADFLNCYGWIFCICQFNLIVLKGNHLW